MSGAQAFFGRNLMTNFTRPNFEACDFNWRNNISCGLPAECSACRRSADPPEASEAFRLAKSAGNLCIFEHILPVKAEEWKERSFEELLKNRKSGSSGGAENHSPQGSVRTPLGQQRRVVRAFVERAAKTGRNLKTYLEKDSEKTEKF